MALPINTLTSGINNPTNTISLSIDQDFILASNQRSLIIANCSNTESVTITIKGTRSTINLSQYGDENISDGLTENIGAFGVCTFAVQLMYKHFGEYGDNITVSSVSPEKAKVICWLSE